MLLLKIFKKLFFYSNIHKNYLTFRNTIPHGILCIDLIVFISLHYKITCKLLLINNVYRNKPFFYKNKKADISSALILLNLLFT
ncbi:hypothetical protein CN553_20980 [Bacillus cereus]|uniref:Uncharacterized protein n=1 Tax=Bacillus cereus TaxID=1396 RepID=A0A9X6U919_BACCE|nr:hypothetical protein CN553_20980 [Bacillus cereus]